MFCHACHAEVPEGAAFCPACGARIPSAPVPRFCSECASELEPDGQFCSSVCGARADVGAVAEGAVGPDAERSRPSPAQGEAGASLPDPFTYVEPAYPEEALADSRASDPSSPISIPLSTRPAPFRSRPLSPLRPPRRNPAPPVAGARSPSRSASSRRSRSPAAERGGVGVQHRAQEAAEAEAGGAYRDGAAPGADRGVRARLGHRGGGIALPGARHGHREIRRDRRQAAVRGQRRRGHRARPGVVRALVEASPIAADGTVYEASGETIELSFTSDDATELIDATSQGGFRLTAIDALDVTDDVISDPTTPRFRTRARQTSTPPT